MTVARSSFHHILIAVTSALVLGLMPLGAKAQGAKLVDEEVPGFYQRVLSLRDAELLDAPDGTTLETLAPFQIFYVYDQNPEWTQVGRLVEGEPAGVIATSDVLGWNSSIVATFNNRAVNDRGRAMIFGTEEKLMELIKNEAVTSLAASYREAAIAGDAPPPSGIISIEPEEHTDIRENLYILPIFDVREGLRLPGRFRGKALKIASLSAREAGAPSGTSGADELKNWRAEIVFVIDTTTSMQPVIDAATDAIAEFAQSVADSPTGDRARFGLVEFRDNIELRPQLEYATRTRLDLSEDATIEALLEQLSSVRVTTVSSEGFNEDSLAGLHHAVTQLNWGDKNGKFIFLITDAGPRDDNLTVEDLLEDELNQQAQEKNISISTWHLRTPAGSFDHAAAEGAYRNLSRFGDVAAYTPIEQGTVEAFREVIDDQVAKLVEIIDGSVEGLRADELTTIAPDDPLAQIGLAMQLAYLGETLGTQVPEVIEGWLLQQDIPNFGQSTLDIRIMLTKNQLSTLSTVLETMLTEMERGILDPTTFFDQLQAALALLAQDSNRIASTDLNDLGGAVGAYLRDLPYNSDIMGLTQDDWIALGGPGQQQKMQSLRSKLRTYQDLYADDSLWTKLDESATEGEDVSLIPIELMP